MFGSISEFYYSNKHHTDTSEVSSDSSSDNLGPGKIPIDIKKTTSYNVSYPNKQSKIHIGLINKSGMTYPLSIQEQIKQPE